MMTNKNIDRLFQEKLKNLDAKPSAKVWSGIESKLKKKKRRVLPMWWLGSGVAAILILGFLLFPFSDNSVIDQKIENDPIITSSPEKNNIEKKKNVPDKYLEVFEDKKITKKTVVATKEPEDKKLEKSKKTLKKEPYLISKNEEKVVKKDIEKHPEKESLVSEKIAMEKILLTHKKTDSLLKKEQKPNSKKDFLSAIENKDSIKIKPEIKKKWAVSPVFAVLSSNSFSNSSSLDARLNSNKKSGESTYSYGIKVDYKINKKWAVQSGIHLQEIAFSTKNVSVYSGSTGTNLSNINSKTSLFFDSSPSSEVTSLVSSSLNSVNNKAVLNQSFGYIEIPLEIKYNLFNSEKINTNLVSGFSSLFLNKNSIRVKYDDFSEDIGEANNLNSINFSGNVGVDFNFYFDKNWLLNINPMFKTQFNTFSKNTNGFQPYYLGIYTGIKYQF